MVLSVMVASKMVACGGRKGHRKGLHGLLLLSSVAASSSEMDVVSGGGAAGDEEWLLSVTK